MNFSNISNITMSDSISGYMTPDEDDEAENTQYLSVLNEDMSFEGMNITLENSQSNENGNETQLVEVASDDQPIIFTFDNSNEIFGVQVARDEEGNLQKYQIQYSENVNGELVPMLETIQMLPLDDEIELDNSQSADTLTDENQGFEEIMSNDQETDLINSEPRNEVYLKQEMNICEQNFEVFEETDELNDHHISPSGDISHNLTTYEAVSIKQEQHELLIQNSSNEQQCEEFACSEINSQQIDLNIENIKGSLVQIEERDDAALLQHFEIENCIHQEHEEELNEENVEQNHFEQLFIQENHLVENSDLIESTTKNEADNGMYHIVEGIHITGDIESDNIFEETGQTILKETIEHHTKTNILKKSPQNTISKDQDGLEQKVVYVETYLEKENMEFLKLGSSSKPNSRSLLKCNQPVQVSKADPLQVESPDDKYTKRYSRTKEAKQARQFLNFINSTTIPLVPERKQRLPRKQQIKPLKHLNEDIVVKEMIVSSNGFIEPISAEEKKCLPVMEYVELLDSGDESNMIDLVKKRKKSSQNSEEPIEINTSDSEESESVKESKSKGTSSDQEHIETEKIKKKRGRPPKNKQVNRKRSDLCLESPPKIIRTESEVESVTSTLSVIRVVNEIDEKSNPSEVNHLESNVPSEVEQNSPPGNEIEYAIEENSQEVLECQDIFNKDESNKLLLQSAVVANSSKLHTKSILEYKYECDKCKVKFINKVLLNRHDCCTKSGLPFACDACSKRFPNTISLNVHKRVHTNKTSTAKSVLTKIPLVATKTTVKKSESIASTSSKLSVASSKLATGVSVSQTANAQLILPRRSILPRQSTLPSRNPAGSAPRNPLRPALSSSNVDQSTFLKPRISVLSVRDKTIKPNGLKLDNQSGKSNSLISTELAASIDLKVQDKNIEQKKVRGLARPIKEHNGISASPALTRNFLMLKSKFQ